MKQVLTLSCKLEVPLELRPIVDATMRAFAAACNVVRAVAEERETTNKIKLQSLVYHDLRAQFGLSANLAIRAIARVAAVLKAKHKGSTFHPTSVDYDQRIFRFSEKDWTASLTLLGGSRRFKLLVGHYQKALLVGKNPTSAKLVRLRNGHYYLQIALNGKPPAAKEPKGVLGVDLGIKNLATLSTGERFGGAEVEAIRDRYQAMRAVLQAKGTKGARRLLRRLSGREQRYMAWINHTISARIMRFARHHALTVTLEDLTGIRNRNKVRKAQRHRHYRWSFYQLRGFLSYKAMRDGVALVLIDPAYTSQTCHRCLHIGSRAGESFKCAHCGYSGHADYNGARNIRLLGECVTLPGHSLSCLLAG
ncbi:MAG: transposase [Cyanobacteria bacterium RYN_339]|nr:transposase [Cyanobacteria bacterium RYN_339]